VAISPDTETGGPLPSGAASFYTLEPGTPVTDRFGHAVGEVVRVLIAGVFFDGIVVSTVAGDRFVDAPEVRHIEPDEVDLRVTLSDVLFPGPEGPPAPPAVRNIRWDRVDATEDDRAAAITTLKVAFIEDRLEVGDLERRVDLVHAATELSELDSIVADLV
jgi:hypothetical protein